MRLNRFLVVLVAFTFYVSAEAQQAKNIPRVGIEQARKFDPVINLKTAKQLGLTIPPNVLARANKVIK